MAWACLEKNLAFASGKPVVVFNSDGLSVQVEACYQWVDLADTTAGTSSSPASSVTLDGTSIAEAWAWGFGSILTLWLVGISVAAVVRTIRHI